eukprot:6365164-Prymnesium_polylepis.1
MATPAPATPVSLPPISPLAGPPVGTALPPISPSHVPPPSAETSSPPPRAVELRPLPPLLTPPIGDTSAAPRAPVLGALAPGDTATPLTGRDPGLCLGVVVGVPFPFGDGTRRFRSTPLAHAISLDLASVAM